MAWVCCCAAGSGCGGAGCSAGVGAGGAGALAAATGAGGGTGSSACATRVDWTGEVAGRALAGAGVCLGFGLGGVLTGGTGWRVAPMKSTLVRPPLAAPCGVLMVGGLASNNSSNISRCSTALTMAAIQGSRRSAQDVARGSARCDVLLMPPRLRRECGPSWGVCRVRPVGAPS
ncbi:hypothetical protein F0H32_00640 [Xanthomonas translucens pv. undulosa]|nr:hypothetical protein F0H32_00640 [Xanthomonas translucens pv. undulosa]